MAKRMKKRVEVGRDEQGNPIYKWVDGYSQQELMLAVGNALLNNGLIGSEVQCQPLVKATPTLKAYSELWMNTYKEDTLRYSTILGYRTYLKKHIYPAFGDMPIDMITTTTIQEFYNKMSREGKSKSTIQQMKIVLQQIFSLAVEESQIVKSPMESKHLHIPSTKAKTREALPEETLQSIIRDIPRLSNLQDKMQISLLCFTGMRRGEVLALVWEDIDMKQNLINVRKSICFQHNSGIVVETKSKAGVRIIPLLPQLLDNIQPLGKHGYILDNGGEPYSEQMFRRTWQRIGKAIDLNGATPHVFRHSYATMANNAGMDMKSLQSVLGHANIATTMEVYAHSQTKQIQSVGKILGKAFSPVN